MFGMFREKALTSKSDRMQLDRLLTVTLRHEKIVFAVVGALILLMIAWLQFGSIVRSVSVDGVLIAPGIRHELSATEAGHLTDIFVIPGDYVEAGDPVARQTLPKLEQEMAILAAKVARLETKLATATGSQIYIEDHASVLQAARSSLLQLEASSSVREMIISPVAGEIMTLHRMPNDRLTAGTPVVQLREADSGPTRVVAGIAPSVAMQVRSGLEAQVDIVSTGGVSRTLRGQVISVKSELAPAPNWLAALLGSPFAAGGHRLDISLDEDVRSLVTDGMPCRIRIFLPSQTPLSLVFPGRA